MQINPQSLPALANLAWLLATGPEPELRNGAEAVQLAERAGQLARQPVPWLLTALAAAYAEAGRYDDAVTTAKKAIESAGAGDGSPFAAANRKFLKFYLAQTAWHQTVLGPGPAEWNP